MRRWTIRVVVGLSSLIVALALAGNPAAAGAYRNKDSTSAHKAASSTHALCKKMRRSSGARSNAA
jgi:hypothetical protein